jgi:hypothetical protein
MTDTGSRFVSAVQIAVVVGRLPERFRVKDVRQTCPGWADRTYNTFLAKHRRGNPGGYTEHFERHTDGTYSLLKR